MQARVGARVGAQLVAVRHGALLEERDARGEPRHHVLVRGCHVGNPAQLPVSPTNAVAAEVRYHMQRQGRRFSATHSAVLQLLDATGGRTDPLD